MGKFIKIFMLQATKKKEPSDCSINEWFISTDQVGRFKYSMTDFALRCSIISQIYHIRWVHGTTGYDIYTQGHILQHPKALQCRSTKKSINCDI